MALRRAGRSEREISACSDFGCPTCVEQQLPKIAQLGKLSSPKDLNDHIFFDGAEWTDPQGKTYPFYHFIDNATNFHPQKPTAYLDSANFLGLESVSTEGSRFQ